MHRIVAILAEFHVENISSHHVSMWLTLKIIVFLISLSPYSSDNCLVSL